MLRIVKSLACLVSVAFTLPVSAADVAAGKARVESQCAECHKPSDWSGESNAALESLIKDIVAGKVKHAKRRLQLSPQDISDIAAYWTGGRK